MTATQLYKAISHTAGCTQKEAEALVTNVFYVISEELSKAGCVKVPNFGRFYAKRVKATFEEKDGNISIVTPEYYNAKFSYTIKFKDTINRLTTRYGNRKINTKHSSMERPETVQDVGVDMSKCSKK